ncbi:dephospho-CoA kinase [Myxacorys almedinensis]|uniref:Dephospho-CoA kinase n=1 Tax=Myxacorys almedinensis A TaxID=2690445 RepID=A0A8J8CGR4_9CYAN|nr:dephospho-CoA kinase [Myxacorys almedinensis]NDJ16008.1 dephospho-CoA kinase [Myxacorys almedinensis A]
MTEKPNPRIIGLTGGIGMGKTTVSTYLANRYLLPILDADHYARAAVQPGTPILAAIRDRYGTPILHPDGNLNRRRLGDIIFQNATERTWLESHIHPYVRQAMTRDLSELCKASQTDSPKPEATIVLVIPLLFEAGLTDLVDEIWVVYTSDDQQIQRLIERETLTSEQARDRIKSQMPIQEKCDRAHVILDNSSTVAALLKQVDHALHTQFHPH